MVGDLLVQRRRLVTDLVRGFELAEMLELVWDPSFGLWCPVLPLWHGAWLWHDATFSFIECETSWADGLTVIFCFDELRSGHGPGFEFELCGACWGGVLTRHCVDLQSFVTCSWWQVTRTRCKTNKLKILKSWNILRFKRVFHTLRFGWFNILFNLLLAHHGGSALTSGYQTSAFQEQYEKALLLMELHASHIFAYFGSWHASPCTSQKLVSVPWIFAEPC